MFSTHENYAYQEASSFMLFTGMVPTMGSISLFSSVKQPTQMWISLVNELKMEETIVCMTTEDDVNAVFFQGKYLLILRCERSDIKTDFITFC